MTSWPFPSCFHYLFLRNNMTLLVLFFYLFLFTSNSSTCSEISPFSPHISQNLAGLKKRMVRSPFLPPTVTSFKPSMRRKNKTQDFNLRVSFPTGLAQPPPFVIGRTTSFNRTKDPDWDENFTSKLVGTNVKSGTNFPRPPMVFHQSKIKDKEAVSSPQGPHTFVLPQNDHYSSYKEQSKFLHAESIKDDKGKEKMYSPVGQHQQNMTEYQEVLKTIKTNSKELEEILRKAGISLDSFLNFISKGVTKQEVFKYLNFSQAENFDHNSSKDVLSSANSSPSASEKNLRAMAKNDRQNFLTDLPFTEIVHEVSLGKGKPIQSLGKLPWLPGQIQPTHNSNIIKTFGIHESPKWKTKSELEENAKFISGFELEIPSKDIPIITPFQPSRKKNTNEASIISLTIEAKDKHKSYDPMTKLSIRNKIFSVEEMKEEAKPKSQAKGRISEHQENLRLVFPMRGILLFCGGLGILSFVIIILLTVYSAVKCNTKKSVNNYQQSESSNLSVFS